MLCIRGKFREFSTGKNKFEKYSENFLREHVSIIYLLQSVRISLNLNYIQQIVYEEIYSLNSLFSRNRLNAEFVLWNEEGSSIKRKVERNSFVHGQVYRCFPCNERHCKNCHQSDSSGHDPRKRAMTLLTSTEKTRALIVRFLNGRRSCQRGHDARNRWFITRVCARVCVCMRVYVCVCVYSCKKHLSQKTRCLKSLENLRIP